MITPQTQAVISTPAQVYAHAPLLRALATLQALADYAQAHGIPADSPGLVEPKAVLQSYEAALASRPQHAMGSEHSSGPWHGEHYEGDNGASLCITSETDGVLALLPYAQLDDLPAPENAGALNAKNAPRESFDIANLRRVLACVNACEGIPTPALESLRPDIKPFVDNRGEHFVIYSESEFKQSGDGAGYWSNHDGWTALEGATRFTQEETGRIRMPVTATPGDAQWSHVTDALHFNQMIEQINEEPGGMKP